MEQNKQELFLDPPPAHWVVYVEQEGVDFII